MVHNPSGLSAKFHNLCRFAGRTTACPSLARSRESILTKMAMMIMFTMVKWLTMGNMLTMTLVTVWTLMSDLARLRGLLDSGERTMTVAPGGH